MATTVAASKRQTAIDFAHQAERLSLLPHNKDDAATAATTAVQARFVTPQDPVIELANGGRLPAVPLEEAAELNQLRERLEDSTASGVTSVLDHVRREREQGDVERADERRGEKHTNGGSLDERNSAHSTKAEASLRTAVPPSRTNPLFPPLPLYGPPSFLRNLHCTAFRFSSFFLSLAFLGVIVLGSAFTSIPLMFRHIGLRLTFRDPNARRPFYLEEQKRKKERAEAAKAWKRQKRRRSSSAGSTYTKMVDETEEEAGRDEEFEPTEGGKDPLICDVGYYARRVGLDVEEFKVQTEDGFIIVLWHVFNPKEYRRVPVEHRGYKEADVFPTHQTGAYGASKKQYAHGKRRYPVLMVHGLLQSAGAYCTNDDDSLAFFLCKSGYDVWLGNNRCGFKPEHQLLQYADPRMWAWNIRQMGVMDLPALVSRVLSETGFEKLGLICHSQGTTETFVALAKEQRPELGEKISVFCALAPAAYAGPLIGKMYFKFMRVISPGLFRVFFGIHAFIPFMMTMHGLLPGKLYGALGYRVFSFLFNWTDDRWEQDLRDRMFQFAPVYVSAETMRWWLGRECFATQKCILATREEGKLEDEEDEGDENGSDDIARLAEGCQEPGEPDRRGKSAWYNEQVPPFALWVAGSDDLVDGRRLLRRFTKVREPHVRVVHSKVIEEYEHLDVIWAMDSIEKVGKEVREVLWKATSPEARQACRVPKGCEEIESFF